MLQGLKASLLALNPGGNGRFANPDNLRLAATMFAAYGKPSRIRVHSINSITGSSLPKSKSSSAHLTGAGHSWNPDAPAGDRRDQKCHGSARLFVERDLISGWFTTHAQRFAHSLLGAGVSLFVGFCCLSRELALSPSSSSFCRFPTNDCVGLDTAVGPASRMSGITVRFT